MRLIDANKEVIRAYEDIPEPYSDVLISFLRGCEHIDPESLPIVQQLRAELAQMKAERDAESEGKRIFCSGLLQRGRSRGPDRGLSEPAGWSPAGLGKVH